MGYKIFVSYKYGDTDVKPLKAVSNFCYSPLFGCYTTHEPTKVRDYVTELQNLLEKHNHINKGEADGESLANFKDSTIASKLRDKIFDSSVTIVIISPGMKDYTKSERDQWIPWEISYSLCEYGRNGRTSHSNAMLAVVLPDRNGRYLYCIDDFSASTTIHTENLFKILRDNMSNCTNLYSGERSYIPCIKWCDFILMTDFYIERAIRIRENIKNYNVCKEV